MPLPTLTGVLAAKMMFRPATVSDNSHVPYVNRANVATIAIFLWQLGGATSIAAGQTITLSSILESVPHLAPEVSPAEVINAGPVGLPHEAPSLVVLKILRSIWNTAISRAMFFSLAMACAAVPLTLGMEFLNSKTIAIESENGTIVDKDRHLDLCQPKSDGGILASSANLKEKTEIT